MEIAINNSEHCVSMVDFRTIEFRHKNLQNSVCHRTDFITVCEPTELKKLSFYSDDEPEFRIQFENLSLSPADIEVELVHKNGASFQIAMDPCSESIIRKRKFMSREDLLTWCHEDGSVLYRITFADMIVNSKLTLGVYNHFVEHSEKLEKMFLDRGCTDVTFEVGDQEISAAKIFLVSGSNVFAAMFGSEWKDSKNGRILIEDVDYEVLYELIKFMYTGKCRIKNYDFALNLYQAAERYNVDDVKKDAKDYICKRLNDGKVIRVMLLADLNNDVEMLTAAVNYIVKITTLKVSCLPDYNLLDRKLLSRLLIEMWDVYKSNTTYIETSRTESFI